MLENCAHCIRFRLFPQPVKGTMSEAELHIIKARMLEGRRAKAERGELGRPVPMGYVRRPSGEIVLDPDEQAQTTIRLVFDLFERWRTIGKVMSHFARHDIRLPVRVLGGPNKGELEWRRPSRPTLQNLFTNPIYAGAVRPESPMFHHTWAWVA